MTLIGDHTDYNGGLSLPMAIDLATEVTFTPKSGSFLFGIDSDQFPGQPIEILLGDTAPVPHEAALAAGLLRAQAPPWVGSPGSRAPCRSGRGCPRAPRSRWRCCSPSATTPIPSSLAHDCQEAERSAGSHVGLLDPLAIAGAVAGHALHIDFATLQTRQVPIPDDAAFVIVHSEAPRLLTSTPYATPARRMRTGRAHHRAPARPLRDR